MEHALPGPGTVLFIDHCVLQLCIVTYASSTLIRHNRFQGSFCFYVCMFQRIIVWLLSREQQRGKTMRKIIILPVLLLASFVGVVAVVMGFVIGFSVKFKYKVL